MRARRGAGARQRRVEGVQSVFMIKINKQSSLDPHGGIRVN